MNAGHRASWWCSPARSRPTFDAEEADWLAGYAAALSIALDRVRVAELSGQTAAELRNARDLAEAASRAKSEFLSRVSHELRTPLTAMIGFAELLLGHRARRPSRSATSAPSSRRATTSSALVNDILDISRIEEGRLALSPEPVSVRQVVGEVLDLTRPMAGELDTTVRVPGIPGSLSVAADHQRLKQVLLNLVTNAIKYNRRGGWVEISATPPTARCRVCGPGQRAGAAAPRRWSGSSRPSSASRPPPPRSRAPGWGSPSPSR